jgi:import receptor subunit TOM22
MVEFEEIEDDVYSDTSAVAVADDEDVWSDESSEDDDDDEVDIANKTLFDRIVALKDIIRGHRRDAIARTLSKAYSYGSLVTYIGGKAVYVVVTLALLIAIAYEAIREEEQLALEFEQQLQTQKTVNEVPTPP